jgi:hypothetical protein
LRNNSVNSCHYVMPAMTKGNLALGSDLFAICFMYLYHSNLCYPESISAVKYYK